MAVISTKELFDRYFERFDKSRQKKTRAQIERPEVYAYEQKIGKQLVDMNVDELFDMLISFKSNRSTDGANYVINYNSFYQIASGYRDLFNFYNQITDETIVNPWYDKRLRGKEATRRIAQKKPAFTYAVIENVIDKVHARYEEERANYIECIILLFYCGFSCAKEIVNIEESMIDVENRVINLRRGRIHLSERCFELLQYVHEMNTMQGWRGDYVMASWRDKYFRYTIRPKMVESFDERTENDLADLINRKIIVCVKNEFGVEINYRLLYLCGFYDSLVRKYGEDRAQAMILSTRNKQDTKDLTLQAEDYGIDVNNISQFKRYLRPLVNDMRKRITA